MRDNNRAESSHLSVPRRERKMQRFKSQAQAQRFVSTYGAIYNLSTSNITLFHEEHYAPFGPMPGRDGWPRPSPVRELWAHRLRTPITLNLKIPLKALWLLGFQIPDFFCLLKKRPR